MQVDVAAHTLSTSYLRALIGPSDEDPRPDSVDPQDAIGGILGKVLDGTDWMVNFDLHPRAIDGLDTIGRRVRDHEDKGRGWLPWANVRGYNASQEGAMAGEIAVRVRNVKRVPHDRPAVFIANVEPYPQFWPWRNDETINRSAQYLAAFKRSGGTELRLWIDARGWQLSLDRGIGLSRWQSQAAAHGLTLKVMPEIYWTDFNIDPSAAIAATVRTLETFRIAPENILPTFPGDATPQHMIFAFRRAYELGWGKPNIWQRMNLREDTALAIAGLDDLWAPQPPPPPMVEVPVATLEALRAEGLAIRDEMLVQHAVGQRVASKWGASITRMGRFLTKVRDLTPPEPED